jgi:hypothetical protein
MSGGMVEEVIENYPIIVNELSIPKGFVSKETMVEVKNVIEKKVRAVILTQLGVKLMENSS